MNTDLIALGAPALPAGMFYRVRRGYAIHHVEIRRRRRIGSVYVRGGSAAVVLNVHPAPIDALVAACRRADEGRRLMEQLRAVESVLELFQGDHEARGEQQWQS